MAAGKANYIIIWKKSSQVYSATSLETAVKTPVPKGCVPEDKRILHASFLPDEEEFNVYLLPQEEIDQIHAEIAAKLAAAAAEEDEGSPNE